MTAPRGSVGGTLERFWKGHITGTNRGRAVTSIRRRGESLRVDVVFDDRELGVAMASFGGVLAGTRTALHLLDIRDTGGIVPVEIQLALRFSEDLQLAEGEWQSDVGTRGICVFRPTRMSHLKWWVRCADALVRIFLRRYTPLLYTLFLIILAALAVAKVIEVSYAALALLLVSAPYVYRTQLVELIEAFRIRKIGPVELAQNPITEDVRSLIYQQVQEAQIFLTLNSFLVLRTKLLLVWLAQVGPADRTTFNASATALGVPSDNIDVTWQALVQSGCAVPSGAHLVITDLGRRYVAYLLGMRG